MLIIAEIIALITTIALIALWIIWPEKNVEPWTVLSSITFILTDLCRRYGHNIPFGSLNNATTKEEKLRNWVIDNALEKNLSETLPKTLAFAKLVENHELEHWARLELYGYYQENGMKKEDVVPEYRAVAGRWIDNYNNILDLSHQPELGYVNEYRFRSDIKMLEELANKKDFQNISDVNIINIIRKNLSFDAVRFCFNPIEVKCVLNGIKNRLLEKITL